MNLWMKRAIGAAALSGGLLALSAGAASAQDVSADVSARLGRPTSAEVRVCADGRVLSGGPLGRGRAREPYGSGCDAADHAAHDRHRRHATSDHLGERSDQLQLRMGAFPVS